MAWENCSTESARMFFVLLARSHGFRPERSSGSTCIVKTAIAFALRSSLIRHFVDTKNNRRLSPARHPKKTSDVQPLPPPVV
eukprot:5918509-Pyramimonas_sp.AAC.1